MIVLDTNIIIYLVKGELSTDIFPKNTVLVCPTIVVVELLGYHNIKVAEERKLRSLIKDNFLVADLDEDVVESAISIRQELNVKTPDAIVAGTAITFDAELWTANTKDYNGINELKLVNPFESNKNR